MEIRNKERKPMKFGVYVRSIGERTENLCLESCYQFINPENVHLLKNFFPSYKVYKEMFIRAMKSDYDWYLAIDADIILYENWLKVVIDDINRCDPQRIYKFNYLVDDYILKEPVNRGNHIYNNKFSKYALKELKANIRISKFPMFLKKHYEKGRYLKPETSIRHKMKEKYNLGYFKAEGIIGIHGSEQYLKEIFRRFAIRANRNPDYSNKYMFLHKSNQLKLFKQGDIDRFVANLGWNYGLVHIFNRIDARILEKYEQIIQESGVKEKTSLDKNLNWFYNKLITSKSSYNNSK